MNSVDISDYYGEEFNKNVKKGSLRISSAILFLWIDFGAPIDFRLESNTVRCTPNK